MIIPLQCRCGAVRGTLEAEQGKGLRVVCYCDDCRAYARALERDDVLDAHGGTDVWQSVPARIALTQGREHVRCLRLSDKGLLRWHTACCRTPIANTMPSPRLPFAGVHLAFMDHAQRPGDGALGPAAGVQGRFAVGGVPPGAHASASIGIVARAAALLARGFLAGAHRPTPFFDGGGRPVVAPRVLSPSEREALDRP